MTNIPYLDEVLNLTSGCTPASEGCENCYASNLHNRRHAANVKEAMVFAGLHDSGERHIRSSEGWPQSVERVGAPPEGWAVRGRDLKVRMPCPQQYDLPFACVRTLPERLERPLHWRRPRRVGVCFTSDLFHEKVPDEFLDKVFAVMALTPQHTYVLLTKRPERMRAYLTQDWDEDKQIVGCRDRIYMAAEEMGGFDYIPDGFRWPLPNVWLGVSVEDQQTADERIPLLLETPAAHRWLSCEPLLEAVDLTDLSAPAGEQWDCLDRCEAADAALEGACAATLDWVVVGGESGPKAREMDLVSLVLVMKQCEEAGVPAYCKQDSGPRPGQQGRIPDPLWAVKQLPDGWA